MKPKLTPEERKKRASDAAKKRWSKVREKATAHVELAPPPLPEPIAQAVLDSPRKPKAAAPIPKEFRSALSYAQKRYAKAQKEFSEYLGKVEALKIEMSYLIQNIKALGGTPNAPSQHALYIPNVPAGYPTPETNPMQFTANLPPIPIAHGGAMGVIGEHPMADENMFLNDPSSPASGGPWV